MTVVPVCGGGWLGSNEVSPQIPGPSGGSLALDPGHPKSDHPDLELLNDDEITRLTEYF